MLYLRGVQAIEEILADLKSLQIFMIIVVLHFSTTNRSDPIT